MTLLRTLGRTALFTLPLALIACTEPSTKGGTLDQSPTAASQAAPSDGKDAPEVPAEDAQVLAAGAETSGPELAEGEADANPDPAVAEAEKLPSPDDPRPEEPRRVLIVGASLAATGFGPLLEKRLDAHPDVLAYRKGKSASGLARPDYYDWFDQGWRQVEFRKPDLVVVIMGANDGQDIAPWKGEKRVHWDSEGWPEAYRGRVDHFLQQLIRPAEEGEEGARVMWLGLPMMTSPSLERKLKVIREVQEQAVVALGANGLYLDTTPYLVDEDGELLDEARVQGKNRAIRSEDGVHFTMSGGEYLAEQVYPEILLALGLPDRPAEDEDAK